MTGYLSDDVRKSIRSGVNLAELPPDVIAGLRSERARCAERYLAAKRHADRLHALLPDRMRVERELGLLGDLEALVRADLNRLMSKGKA